MKTWKIAIVVAAFAAVVVGQASADVISGASVTEDNYIQGNADNAGSNNGASQYLQIGRYSTDIKRGVIRFDVSSIAPTSGSDVLEVSSITLRLYYLGYATVSAGNTLSLYQIDAANAAWDEDTSNWDNASTSTPWSGGKGLGAPGSGYAATSLATSVYVDNTSTVGYMDFTFTGDSAALTDLINLWNTAGGNAGLLIRSDDTVEGGSGTRDDAIFASSNGTYAPQLVVNYSYVPVPEPATMAMLGLGGVMMLVRRRRR